ncbi:MAG TPA: hypothetical protein VK063_03900 [Beutenbergiaceae bacterium]|nr:hypothetical protein [Beutenbergiaceae bacterium]
MRSASEEIAEALQAVERLPQDDVAAHVPAFEALHRTLQDRLADAEN